jgi:hypothetical protein
MDLLYDVSQINKLQNRMIPDASVLQTKHASPATRSWHESRRGEIRNQAASHKDEIVTVTSGVGCPVGRASQFVKIEKEFGWIHSRLLFFY